MTQAVRRGMSRENEFVDRLKSGTSEDNLDVSFDLLGLSVEDVREALGPVIDVIEDGVEGILKGIEVLESVIEIVKSAIEILAILLGIYVDIFEALVLAAKEILEQVKQLFEGTSISLLKHIPKSQKSRRSSPEILYDIGTAFTDRGDGLRPVSTTGVYGISIVGVFSYPSFEGLKDLYEQVMKLIRGFSDPAFSWKGHEQKYGSKDFYSTSPSTHPDFSFNMSLIDIPAIAGLVIYINILIDMLQTAKTFAARLNAIINAVLTRVQRIKDLLIKILNTVANLLAFLTLLEGSNIIVVEGEGTSEQFGQKIMNAPNDPNFPSVSLDGELAEGVNATRLDKSVYNNNSFAGGVCIHLQAGASSENIKRLKNIKNLFVKDILDKAEKDLNSKRDDIADSGTNLVSNKPVPTGWTQIKRDED